MRPRSGLRAGEVRALALRRQPTAASLGARARAYEPELLHGVQRDVDRGGLPAALLSEESVVEIAPVAAEGRWRQALAAILYLLDPYDAVPDRYGVLGYPDDIAVLSKTHAILRN